MPDEYVYAYFACKGCSEILAIREMERMPKEGEVFDLPYPFVMRCLKCRERHQYLLEEMKVQKLAQKIQIVNPIHPAILEAEEDLRRTN